jgi:ketosteroid isomerase-like protein
MTIEAEVRAAADALMADFGGGRVEEYFARLAPDATFLFYTAPGERLESRAAYRSLWERWETEDGFRVLGSVSSNRAVRPLGPEAAVLSHDVATRVATSAGEENLTEQETIVFARRDGAWLVVHEHLSAGAARG